MAKNRPYLWCHSQQNQNIFFIADSKTCRVFWGFEQLSRTIGWGAMQLVSQPKYPCFFLDFQVWYIRRLAANMLMDYLWKKTFCHVLKLVSLCFNASPCVSVSELIELNNVKSWVLHSFESSWIKKMFKGSMWFDVGHFMRNLHSLMICVWH